MLSISLGNIVRRRNNITAYQKTLDEIAALNRRIDTCNLLIVYHAKHPPLVRLIDEIKHDYRVRLAIAERRRDRLQELLTAQTSRSA